MMMRMKIRMLIITEKNNSKTKTSTSFKYKTKLIGNKPDNNSRLDAEVVAPLKYLSNFGRSLDLALINCVISEISITPEISTNTTVNLPGTAVAATLTNGATFQISNTKLYAPVVTLSINDNIK